MYIYLDESGDLGFNFRNRKTTKKFVITLLICSTNRTRKSFRKAVKRTISSKIHRKTPKKHGSHELKGTRTSLEVKKYFLQNLQDENWEIYSLILNKVRVNDDLRTKKGKKKLYNYLARVLLEKVSIRLKSALKIVELIVDKSKNTEEVKDFNAYLEYQLEALLPLDTKLNIYHLKSTETPELQAVDLFCWGIFRKYEIEDLKWYDCFKDKVRFETEYLK